jgi:geranylgeranyl pyrophosphate synthase
MHNPKLIEIFTEELLNLHRGQGMDLYWRDSLTCPSEADYLEMVGNKTGGLFRLAIKLMQAESAVDVYVLYSLPPYPFTTTIHAPLHYSWRLRVLTCKLK